MRRADTSRGGRGRTRRAHGRAPSGATRAAKRGRGPSSSADGRGGLRRALGLPALTFYGVGMVIGAGVYSVLGAAAGRAGEGLWLAVALAAVAALLTGLSYAELASALPRAGAEYVYVGKAFPRRRWAPFAIAFTRVAAGAGTAATVSIAFAGYFEMFAGSPRWAAALGLLVACTALNVVGIRESTWANVACTSIEALGLLAVVWVGATSERFGEALATPPSAGVLSGAALIFFVYLGFEALASFAEETREPGRAMPRAILLSLALTTALYVLVALAAVALVPPERLAESRSPLAAAVEPTSSRLARVLGGIALFATANTVLVTLMTSSRMLFGTARDLGAMKPLTRVLPGRRTPWVAALVLAAGAAALLPFGEVEVVAGFASFVSLVAFVAVNVALVVLRLREPDLERPFRVPVAVGRVPLAPVAGVAASLALATQFEPVVYAIGAGALGLGVAVYFLAVRRRSARAGA